MAKNIDVLEAFVNGDYSPKTNNLYIEGEKLYNYNTCIAERYHSATSGVSFKVNTTKYSMSTTTIQNQLLRLLAQDDVNTVVDVPIGAGRL